MATSTEPSSGPGAAESFQAAGMHAMGMLASGRAWLIFLFTLCIFVQVGLFAAANWADVLQLRVAAPAAAEPAAADAVAPEGEGLAPASQLAGNFLQDFWPPGKWQRIMQVALPVTAVLGLACIAALLVVTVVGIQVNLAARLPAVPAMTGSFYWALLTLGLIFPWGHLTGPLVSAPLQLWAFSSYGEVEAAVVGLPVSQATIWLRFLGWPAMALLSAWFCGARFGNGYWQVVGLEEMQAKGRGDSIREV